MLCQWSCHHFRLESPIVTFPKVPTCCGRTLREWSSGTVNSQQLAPQWSKPHQGLRVSTKHMNLPTESNKLSYASCCAITRRSWFILVQSNKRKGTPTDLCCGRWWKLRLWLPKNLAQSSHPQICCLGDPNIQSRQPKQTPAEAETIDASATSSVHVGEVTTLKRHRFWRCSKASFRSFPNLWWIGLTSSSLAHEAWDDAVERASWRNKNRWWPLIHVDSEVLTPTGPTMNHSERQLSKSDPKI